MDCYRAIVKQLRQLTRRWPKHQGDLSNVDRFKLVSFLVANDVPRVIVAKFADSTQSNLTSRGRKDWDYLVKKSHGNEAYRSRTTAYKLGVGIVYLNGTRVDQARPPPSASVVTLLNLL